MSTIEDNTQMQVEELAALDQVAWQIAEKTLSMRGRASSDMDQTINEYIEHYLMVRRRLIEAFVEDNSIEPTSY